MATGSSKGLRSRAAFPRGKLFVQLRVLFHRLHPGWALSAVLSLYILLTTLWRIYSLGIEPGAEFSNAAASATLLQNDSLVRARMLAALNNATKVGTNSNSLGNHFCVLQPTLSAGKENWAVEDARNHIALRAFLRTFATTVTAAERLHFSFSIYYGHDSDDPVFGDPKLRAAFQEEANKILARAKFPSGTVKLIFTPLYGLHGRINAIWNVLAKDAYYDGCDYFFLSNDDMVFFTPAWVSRSRDSLSGLGSPVGHKRPCRYFGIVRFKDEWAKWATFTFHVSTRMHLEIFGGVYYPVPYNSAHNDYWINLVYHRFDASKYRGEIRVRNRVEDVEYALAHEKDTKHVAPPRYTYDKRGNARKYIDEGRARVRAWLAKYKGTDRCLRPL